VRFIRRSAACLGLAGGLIFAGLAIISPVRQGSYADVGPAAGKPGRTSANDPPTRRTRTDAIVPAAAPGVQFLFGIDGATDRILSIDEETALATDWGPVSSPSIGGLAYDAATGLLYGTDTSTGLILRLDLRDGTTTLGPTLGPIMHGLAIDPADGTLYGVDLQSRLFRINKNIGRATLIGSIGYSTIEALAFDPISGELYGATSAASPKNYLISINKATGAGTFVGFSRRISGLAFDDDGVLYGVDDGPTPGENSSLYRIDHIHRPGDPGRIDWIR